MSFLSREKTDAPETDFRSVRPGCSRCLKDIALYHGFFGKQIIEFGIFFNNILINPEAAWLFTISTRCPAA